MLSNAYFLAKFRFDTAENEPCKFASRACAAGGASHAAVGSPVRSWDDVPPGNDWPRMFRPQDDAISESGEPSRLRVGAACGLSFRNNFETTVLGCIDGRKIRVLQCILHNSTRSVCSWIPEPKSVHFFLFKKPAGLKISTSLVQLPDG